MSLDFKFCADDWGMSPGVNEGIISLAKSGMLYSVSLMADSVFLNYKLSELIILQNTGIKFFLHFNLTNGTETKDVISLTESYVLGHLKSEEIKRKFNVQVQILIDHNVQLSGVDGHHHVHLIPFVFNAIYPEMKKYNISEVRTMEDNSHLGSYSISLLAKNIFRDEFKNFKLNRCGYLMQKNLNSRMLSEKISKFEHIIIHPAKFDDFEKVGVQDQLRQERVVEFNFLMEQAVGKI